MSASSAPLGFPTAKVAILPQSWAPALHSVLRIVAGLCSWSTGRAS